MFKFGFRKFLVLFFISYVICISTMRNEGQLYNSENKLQISDIQKIQTIQNKRILADTTENFKLNYVIQVFLKNYDSRAVFCKYLCSSDSILSFFEIQTCYLTYNCPSMVLQNIFIVIAIFSYLFLPIFMILFGIWNFKCLTHNIAIITGVILINSIYSKLSQQFHEDMQTDYDISSSQATSQNQK